MKPAEFPGNGSSHLIYTTLQTIESYTSKSTYFLFFLLLHYYNTSKYQGPAPVLTVPSPCPKPTFCTPMVTPAICEHLAQPSPKQKQIFCEPRTPQGMTWSGVSVPLKMCQALPYPGVNNWATTSKICLPAVSFSIFQPSHKINLTTPFQFLLWSLKG